jgi:glycosyltransferase 2 family protein
MTKLQKKIINLTFILLIIAFFFLFLRDIEYSKIRSISLSWTPLLIATFFSLAFRYWGVFIWRTILKDLGSESLPKFHLLSSVYAKAWMGRYIPGTVTWIAGKIYLASSIGISKSRLAIASLLEAGMQIVAVTSVSLLLIGFDTRADTIPFSLKFLILVIAGLMLLALNPAIFNRIIRQAFKLIKKTEPGPELKANNKTVLRSFTLYAVGSIISGISYFFLTKSVDPSVSWNLFFYLVGAYNLAGAIGMATPFVPSGLGVRDGIQLVLLSAVFPIEIALVLTIISRLWSAIVDVIFYFSAQIYNKLAMSRL